MMDLDIQVMLIVMIFLLIWLIAAISIVYDFICYIFRMTRIKKLWRHIFETIILLLVCVIGWIWVENPGRSHPAYTMSAQIIILLSLVGYIYFSYRKSVLALWLDIVVNCFLFAGLALMIFCALFSNWLAMWVFMGLPVNILFVQALLENCKKLIHINTPTTTR